jgi:hypothetical protein
MHPAFCERLVRHQIDEAIGRKVFSENVVLEEVTFPAFYVRFAFKDRVPRLIRFECTNYDFQPIQIEPVDLTTREPLSKANWPRRDGGGEFPLHKMKGNNPFFCISGVRDYYTYEGHIPTLTDGRWEKHRSGHRIPDLIEFIGGHFATGKWT